MKKDKKEQEKENTTKLNQETEELQDSPEESSEDLMNKDKRIEELENEAADLKDKLLRKAAEFENYKRRTENDQFNLFKYAAESFIVKLLPIVDDFERSLQHIDNTEDGESIKEGLKLIYDKLMKILNEQGVTKIESVGQPFDVNFHEALMQRKAEDVPPHTVLDELEKGYMYKDRVIRHAKVVVSEENEEQAGSVNSENENKEE
ncbi:MAG TPA: nucleotide exchange factor GrpE [Ignavibacteriaceae bacterium]|jgi:molecular chaperone GrpE|nr:nucleotide exchange factor GrpE [Ignavibacteriaceae bacterium]